MPDREFIKKDLAGEIDEEEINAHFTLLPEQYFRQNGDEDISEHIRLINRFFVTVMTADGVDELEPVVSWDNEKKTGCSVVTITTWDREGLFYKIAGAFARSDVNIFVGKSVTRKDHIAIMTFVVAGKNGGAVRSRKTRNQFSENLREILVHNRDVGTALRVGSEGKKSAVKQHTPVPPAVSIYCELGRHRLIIEIETQDRIGLLYETGKILFSRKLNITWAQLSVKQNIAFGTFRLITTSGSKIKSTGELEKLREELLRKIRAL